MTSNVMPDGWISLVAADSFDQISTLGKSVKTKDCSVSGKYPVVDQGQELITGYIDDLSCVVEVENPIVLFGDHTRAVKWIDFNFVPGADGTKLLKPKLFINNRFSYYQLKSLDIPDKGYARHFKYLKELSFVIPPLAEQQVIADKIDILLAQVESIKARLERIPEILKQFRQSVLTAAVSGKLTEEWEGYDWQDMTIGEIAKVRTGKTPSRTEEKYWENGVIPWLTSSVTGSEYCFKADEFISELASKECNLKPFPVGTLLLAMYGEGKTRGQVTELKLEATCNQACAAIIPNNEIALTSFVKLKLQENYEAIRLAASGGNQPNLNLNKVREINIQVPTLEVQIKIVQEVEKLLTISEEVNQQVRSALDRVNNLTQSILAKAFRGELTAEWREANPELISGENSAKALLERIKAERASVKPATKRGRGKA